MKENQLIVAQGKNHPALYHDAIEAEEIHTISNSFPIQSVIGAKIRYRQRKNICRSFQY